tara:strand:+ start:480 stop:1259 length:780 start_codon:yes stop_codon:yes gene_type:complete
MFLNLKYKFYSMSIFQEHYDMPEPIGKVSREQWIALCECDADPSKLPSGDWNENIINNLHLFKKIQFVDDPFDPRFGQKQIKKTREDTFFGVDLKDNGEINASRLTVERGAFDFGAFPSQREFLDKLFENYKKNSKNLAYQEYIIRLLGIYDLWHEGVDAIVQLYHLTTTREEELEHEIESLEHHHQLRIKVTIPEVIKIFIPHKIPELPPRMNLYEFITHLATALKELHGVHENMLESIQILQRELRFLFDDIKNVPE